MLTRFATAIYATVAAAALMWFAPAGLAQTIPVINPLPAKDAQPLAPPRLVPIPLNAKRAEILFNGTPFVLVGEKKDKAQLAPGVRIFGTDNMLKMSGGLFGKAYTKYQLEPTTGLLMNVWILTDREILTPDPKPDPSNTTPGNMTLMK